MELSLESGWSAPMLDGKGIAKEVKEEDEEEEGEEESFGVIRQ